VDNRNDFARTALHIGDHFFNDPRKRTICWVILPSKWGSANRPKGIRYADSLSQAESEQDILRPIDLGEQSKK